MKVYINNQQVQAEINVGFTETLDETLDHGMVILNNIETATPFAPMQEVRIEVEVSSTRYKKFYFYIIADEVSLFSNIPTTYTHKISFIQQTRKFSKHLMRNTVFAQPAQNKLTMHTSVVRPLLQTVNEGETAYVLGAPCIEINPNEQKRYSFQNLIYISPKIKINKIESKTNTYVFSNASTYTGDKKTHGRRKAVPYKTEYWIEAKPLNGSSVKYLRTNYAKNELNPGSKILSTTSPWNEPFEGTAFVHLDLAPSEEDFITLEELGFPENTTDARDCRYAVLLENDTTIYFYYYTMFDVIDTINKQYQQRRLAFDSSHVLKRDKIFVGIDYDFKQFLKKTVAPNFTFTQMTYYEALAECFKVFDGIMTLDEEGILNIEYYNQIKNKIDNIDSVGMSVAVKEEQYNNALVTYFQRARIQEEYPNDKSYARVIQANFGVDATSPWVMRVPHKIEYIESLTIRHNLDIKVICNATMNGPSDGDVIVFDNAHDADWFKELEIVDVVVPDEIYRLLPTAFSRYEHMDDLTKPEVDRLYKGMVLHYMQGGTDIRVDEEYTIQGHPLTILTIVVVLETAYLKQVCGARFFTDPHHMNDSLYVYNRFLDLSEGFNPEPEWYQELSFHAKYFTQADGRLVQERNVNKYEGEMLSNQNSGGVDLMRLGNNMKGLINKIGENMVSVNLKLNTNFNNCIHKGDYYIDDLGQKWVANICEYSFIQGETDNNLYISETVQFVKNFNMLSQFVRIAQQKRFTEISPSLIMKSEDNIIEYIYYSIHDMNIHETTYMSIRQELFFGATVGRFCRYVDDYDGYGLIDVYNIDYATVVTRYTTPIQFSNFFISYYEDFNGSIEIFMPLQKYAAGNSLCLELSFDHPINGGTQTTHYDWHFGTKHGKYYYARPVCYTDDAQGFKDNVTINFYDGSPKVFDRNFPIVSYTSNGTTTPPKDTLVGSIDSLEYFKTPNETLALNYQLSFLPYQVQTNGRPEVILGNLFFIKNLLVSNQEEETYRLYIGDENELYDEYDTHGKGSWTTCPQPFYDTGFTDDSHTTLYYVELYLIQAITTTGSWAICNSKGEIYIAANQVLNNEHPSIYFIGTHKRL